MQNEFSSKSMINEFLPYFSFYFGGGSKLMEVHLNQSQVDSLANRFRYRPDCLPSTWVTRYAIEYLEALKSIMGSGH